MDDTTITDDRARAFASALQRFEQDSDVGPFADGATVLRFDG